jgi:hypothetical protein
MACEGPGVRGPLKYSWRSAAARGTKNTLCVLTNSADSTDCIIHFNVLKICGTDCERETYKNVKIGMRVKQTKCFDAAATYAFIDALEPIEIERLALASTLCSNTRDACLQQSNY